MAKHFYLTLVALIFLAIAVNAAPAHMEYDMVEVSELPGSRKAGRVESGSVESGENDDDDDDDDEPQQKQNDSSAADDEEEDDDDDDESFIRRRREAVAEPAKETTETETEPVATEQAAEGVTAIPTTSAVPTTRKPVLVLIRDALKKVTSGLPTEQVANNALQYFQLFEHFIQQTIEQVIDAADDDDEETPAAAPTTTPDEDKKPEAAEGQGEKQPEEVATIAAPAPETPIEAASENEVKPAEAAMGTNAV